MMTPDAAFLAAVVAHPADDLRRLVYADWLDEQGDPRGAFLRLEVAAAELVAAGAELVDGAERCAAARMGLPGEWCEAVAVRYDVRFVRPLSNSVVIPCIKAIFEAGGRRGLAESQGLYHRAPSLLELCLPFDAAVRVAENLRMPAWSRPAEPICEVEVVRVAA